MADPMKHGFWQTVPGMMTASAGILSAATGMLVALNQTGVVDLKQLVGAKPAAQTAPTENSSLALRSDDKPSNAPPNADKSVVEANQQKDQPPTTSFIQSPLPPSHGAVDHRPEVKVQPPPEPYSLPAAVARNPAPETESMVVNSTTLREPPTPVRPMQEKSLRVNPPSDPVVEAPRQRDLPTVPAARLPDAKSPSLEPERNPATTQRTVERLPSAPVTQNDGTRPRSEGGTHSGETRKQPESPPIPGARTDGAKKPGTGTDRTAVPAERQADRVPSAAPARNDATRPLPDAPARVAEARKQDEQPSVSQRPNGDMKKPEKVRLSPEEPRAVGKAKASATEPPEKKHSETAGEAKKDKPQYARAETRQPEKAPGSTAAPPTKPVESGKSDVPPAKGPALKLTGLAMKVPQGWIEEKVESSPMGPKAVFKIPKLDAAGEDGMVRITHYANMKGKDKDEMNIDRWIGQVSKPDGKPLTRSDAKITTTQAGPVQLTVVDLSGSVKMTMRDTARPNQRLIAAIVDHPQGPHFVVAAGPAASMEKWAAQIDAFLKSAKVE